MEWILLDFPIFCEQESKLEKGMMIPTVSDFLWAETTSQF
jgi:hypothetical protein